MGMRLLHKGLRQHPQHPSMYRGTEELNMNVIFIITDQQRADHMGCAGNSVLQTPNIDKLASEGTRFCNAYVANPTCMPNRSSIMTGQYPNTCVRSFGVNLPRRHPHILWRVARAGLYVTKVHWQDAPQLLVPEAPRGQSSLPSTFPELDEPRRRMPKW